MSDAEDKLHREMRAMRKIARILDPMPPGKRFRVLAAASVLCGLDLEALRAMDCARRAENEEAP